MSVMGRLRAGTSAVNVRFFLVLAALPPIALALLAVLGAQADASVVMTGSGAHALLGAAWVAAWLASVVVSPIAALAALVSMALGRLRGQKPSCSAKSAAREKPGVKRGAASAPFARGDSR